MNTGSRVIYKGHEYLLAWIGETKYGHKAKLEFTDKSKSFWVSSDLISPADATNRQPVQQQQAADDDMPF